MINSAVTKKLIGLGAEQDVPLARLTTFKIGGPARFLLRVRDASALAEALAVCVDNAIPFALIGNGSDILAPDGGFDGAIIRSEPGADPVVREKTVRAFAGDSLTALARASVAAGFSGMERLCGIPASVGGACAMNAGAYGGEIKDILKSVLLCKNGKIVREDADIASLGYRKSPYSFPGCAVLEAEFRLREGDGTEKDVMQDCLTRRAQKQPLEFPSAGSVFKRPEGHFAGKLIEDAGLKGLSAGGACVSPKHAGFIVNTGGATEKDVLSLIETVQERVLALFGVRLEREIKRLEEIVCTF